LIEQRFLSTGAASGDDSDDSGRQHLTLRDQHANPLEDMLDFENAPSFNTAVTVALPPANDCTPVK
jgi:hypothetical protein